MFDIPFPRRVSTILHLVVFAAALLPAVSAEAQWTNRYPKVEGFSHHVYVEGYELPILSSGPVDPAASPDARHLAFAAQGWIWILDLESGVATRLTRGAGVDSRPSWSPDGHKIAFVRDNGADTAVIIRDLDTGEEAAIDSKAMELDPAFSPDGTALYYASGKNGTIDIWRMNLETGIHTAVVAREGIERSPEPTSDGNGLIYLHSPRTSKKTVWYRSLIDGTERALKETGIAGQAAIASHPSKRAIAYTWPQIQDWRILSADLDDPVPAFELTGATGQPMMPAWSADGTQLYFVTVDERQQFALHTVPAIGGEARPVTIARRDWGVPTGRVTIRTQDSATGAPLPARLAVTTGDGHPIASPRGATHFDPQNGRHYLYSDGEITLTVPAGEVAVTAVHGLMTPPAERSVTARAGETTTVTLAPEPVWQAAEAGWAAADHHFHQNYDGFYRLAPAHLAALMHGEAVDVATPLAANLHNRLQDQAFEGHSSRTGRGGLIKFSQEVRAHFHGHIGLVGPDTYYEPWFWGHFYPDYGVSDLSNGRVLDFSAAHGGLASYVHPISAQGDPFSADNIDDIPLELVSDAVLGDLNGLEVVCAWSDELATAGIWYRLLNIGANIVPTGGTDMFADFHRTPALGVARNYVQADTPVDWQAYFTALKDGKTFVTNGPALIFTIGGKGPGGVIDSGVVDGGGGDGGGPVDWTIDLRSAIAVETVEILVNGEVVWSADGLSGAGGERYSGRIDLPAGGWVAARAHGGETRWPAMDSYPFAHTAPVWIGAVASTEPAARNAARADLLRALDSAEERAGRQYEGVDVTTLRTRLEQARQRLEE